MYSRAFVMMQLTRQKSTWGLLTKKLVKSIENRPKFGTEEMNLPIASSTRIKYLIKNNLKRSLNHMCITLKISFIYVTKYLIRNFEYAVKELPSMQAGLDGFSKHISDVQDYRQAYVS